MFCVVTVSLRFVDSVIYVSFPWMICMCVSTIFQEKVIAFPVLRDSVTQYIV